MSFRVGIMARLGRIFAVARVEVLRVLSDRTSLSLILAVPVLQMALFGFAINPDPRHVTLAIARDLSSVGQADDWLAQIVARTGYFDLVGDGLSAGEAKRQVLAGKAMLGLEWREASAPESAMTLSAGVSGKSIIVDASDPSAVRPAVLALQAAAAPRMEVQWLYNPDQRSAWSIAPALAGVVVMITMLMLGALTLVREREQGSWTSLLATPVSAAEVMLGKLTPYLLLAALQAVAVIGVAHGLLDLPLRGALGALFVAALVLAAAHLGLGFAISALAENQLQAVQGAVFFYLPSILLSGFMFPFHGMPKWAQIIGNMLPLTHFVRAARGVLLRGDGADFVWHQMWPVALFALLSGACAVVCFRRRLD